MKSILIGIALSLIASSAWAERVIVRSGDHEGYSRLVFHLSQRVGWTLSGVKNQRKLLINQKGINWDISDVFERMSKLRIVDIRIMPGGKNGLLINLDCNCQVETFWHGKSMLVLDVKDSDIQVDIGVNKNVPLVIEGQYADFSAPPLSQRYHSYNPNAFQKTSLQILSTALNTTLDENQDANHLYKLGVSSNKGVIINQLRRAELLDLIKLKKIAQGHLTYENKINSDSNTQIQKNERSIESFDHPFQNISLSLSSGQLLADQSPLENHQNNIENDCIAHEILSVEKWGNLDPFTNQLSHLRKRIMRRNLDGGGLENLEIAKLYLYFGLGAEAKQLLKNINIDESLRNVYIAISEIMDESTAKFNVFDDQFHCDSNVALWFILSAKKDSLKSLLNHDAALRALVRLPIHLKKQLGPKLVQNLLEMGQSSASDRFQQALRGVINSENIRSPYNKSTTRTRKEIEDNLSSLIIENNEKSLPALIEVIDRYLDDTMEIPLVWVDLVGSYAHEQRNNNIGELIKHTYVRSLAAAGLYDLAFFEFSKLYPDGDNNYIKRSADLLASYTVRLADDIIFLKHLSHRGKYSNFKISDSVENEVATRLLGLGFSSEALEYTYEKSEQAHQDTRRLIRAKAALTLSKQIDKIGTVDDLQSSPSDILSNESNQSEQQHDNASSKHPKISGDSLLSRNSSVEEYQQNTSMESTLNSEDILEPFIRNSELKRGSISLEQGENLIAESESIRNSLTDTVKAGEDFEELSD